MKLTQIFAAAALSLAAAVVTVEADGITLQVDQVRQRYPWNGLVDIDYTITYDNDATLGLDDNLEVLLVDRDVTPAVTNRAITFLQAPLPLTAGAHRITWDANADGVTNRIDKARFVVKISHYSAVYMVIDVSGGPTADCYPVDFLNGAPPNGFNVEEYKGDKIVLRCVHPGSYIAGSADGEANRVTDVLIREKQHRVALSKSFYLGLFEITQQQYMNVMGGTNPSEKRGDHWQYRPVDCVKYDVIRGSNWPTATEPGEGSFLDRLIQKCKSKGSDGKYSEPVTGFDLPTEFEWEYACRAGTTKAFNRTDDFDNTSSAAQVAELALLGRYKDNVSKGAGGISDAHTIVGSYLPNAWGFYDMHGNVWEWCRDWFVEDPTSLTPRQYRDPAGPDSGDMRSFRGGSHSDGIGSCRSAYRGRGKPSDGWANNGFRLYRSLP